MASILVRLPGIPISFRHSIARALQRFNHIQEDRTDPALACVWQAASVLLTPEVADLWNVRTEIIPRLSTMRLR